jgi:DNA gyrase subunit A
LERDGNLFLVSQGGWGKRLPVTALRLAKLGDIGTHALQFASKDDSLAAMVQAAAAGTVILVTSNGRGISLPVESVALWGKDGTGERVVKLRGGEVIDSAILL